jgi:hypothetical protein
MLLADQLVDRRNPWKGPSLPVVKQFAPLTAGDLAWADHNALPGKAYLASSVIAGTNRAAAGCHVITDQADIASPGSNVHQRRRNRRSWLT